MAQPRSSRWTPSSRHFAGQLLAKNGFPWYTSYSSLGDSWPVFGSHEDLGVTYEMKWFCVVMVAAATAASAIAIARLANHRPAILEAIVAGSLLVIFAALFGFLAKSRD